MWGEIGILFLAAVGLWEATNQASEVGDRKNKYAAALEYAELTGKPLLVVGGPYGPAFRTLGYAGHGYGDVCLDLDPKACHGAPVAVTADIRDIPYPNKTFGAVFVSHVIEHLDTVEDAEIALEELDRVADNVVIAYPEKTGLMAQLHPGHHLWITEIGKDKYRLEQRL